MQNRMISWCRCFFRSCWRLPLVALLAGLTWGVVCLLALMADMWSGREEGLARVLLVILLVLGGLLLLVWLVALVWLVVVTVRCCGQRAWRRLACCWGGLLGAALLVVEGLHQVVVMVREDKLPDFYMLGVKIPEDREFVVPRGLRAVQGDVPPPSERARELLALRPKRLPQDVRVQIPPLPNLEKLTRDAPELLQEYLARCLYAEATNPRFDAQVLWHWDESVALEHEADLQTLALRKPLPDSFVGKWRLPLHGGWALVTPDSYPFAIEHEEQVAGAVCRLEESLAPLAANPSPEGLDALLPPLPQHPFLCLWSEIEEGCYVALVVLPAGYPEGDVMLEAREVSTGKPISLLESYCMPEEVGGSRRLEVRLVTIESGDVNEFYASEWEIWFYPEDGGEPRCVGKQEFLLMGAGLLGK